MAHGSQNVATDGTREPSRALPRTAHPERRSTDAGTAAVSGGSAGWRSGSYKELSPLELGELGRVACSRDLATEPVQLPLAASQRRNMTLRAWLNWKRLLMIFGILVVGIGAVAFGAWQWVFAGYQSGAITHGGRERSFGYYLPARPAPAAKHPLVLVLHGMTMTGRLMAYVTAPDLRPRAKAAQAILVYPTAIRGSWNDRMGDGPPDSEAEDDAGFLLTLRDHFVRNFNADPDRVYVIGLSQGGQMALRLACDHADQLAGVAPLLSSMGETPARECANALPLPVFLLNGTRDPIVKWEGGPVGGSTNPGTPVLLPVDRGVAYWTNRNRVTSGPTTIGYPDRNPKDGSIVVRCDFQGEAAVAFVKVEGGDHGVPITRSAFWVPATCNRDADGIQLAWDFLLRFQRDGERIVSRP